MLLTAQSSNYSQACMRSAEMVRSAAEMEQSKDVVLIDRIRINPNAPPHNKSSKSELISHALSSLIASRYGDAAEEL